LIVKNGEPWTRVVETIIGEARDIKILAAAQTNYWMTIRLHAPLASSNILDDYGS
jgi:hypothetical protein